MTETTQDGADVVERLRALARHEHSDLSICHEAADIIDVHRKTIEIANAGWNKDHSELTRLRTENEALREALRSAGVSFECVVAAAEHEGTDECHEIARRAASDAQLVTAAPDLVEALRDLVADREEVAKYSWKTWMGGEWHWNDEIWERNDPDEFKLIKAARAALSKALGEGQKTMAETTELATGDLMALLREASERITEVKRAFGAPGDYGYGTAEGNALYELYVFRSKLLNALRAPGTAGEGGK